MTGRCSRRGRRRRGSPVHGVIPVDKPRGPTSFAVVRQLRGKTRAAKVGHAGTLDPMATGLLLVCFGEATKAVPWLMDAPKSYEASLRLGVETDTCDAEGEEVRRRPVPDVSAAEIETILERFRGDINQVPPLHSALKRGGERLYEKARRGETVELEPRPVVVHALELVEWAPPRLVLRVRCGKGFYVRSLARDVGDALGCGAHLDALRRTQTAGFDLAQAHPLDRLLADDADWRGALLSPDTALAHLPAVDLTVEESEAVSHGRQLRAGLPWGDEADALGAGRPARLVAPGGQLLAVGAMERCTEDEWSMRVLRGFNLTDPSPGDDECPPSVDNEQGPG